MLVFDVCLFDLDQTLICSNDMTEVRESGKNRTDTEYVKLVQKAYGKAPERHIYSEKLLQDIRVKFPKIKIGVFTRSPRSYAQTVLQLAYPEFVWDVIIAYEDVKKTKPFGDGIDKAMFGFGLKYINRVVLIGDGDADIRSAYHAGSVVVLDKSSWENKLVRDNWKSLEHMPDAVIDSPSEIMAVLENYECFLPDLERRLSGQKGPSRFDRVNKFIPKEIGGGTTPYAIYACGRSFSNYDSLKWRRKWHNLSENIQQHKESDSFPDEWVETVRSFISAHYHPKFYTANLLVTVVPHRPGRKPRLEAFLRQLAASYGDAPLGPKSTISFCEDLLAFKESVKSNHGEFLGRLDRFINIRDNLYVNHPKAMTGRNSILVIDDVSTTGSSLIFAKKHLDDAGGPNVTCLSLAMNISDIHYA